MAKKPVFEKKKVFMYHIEVTDECELRSSSVDILTNVYENGILIASSMHRSTVPIDEIMSELKKMEVCVPG